MRRTVNIRRLAAATRDSLTLWLFDPDEPHEPANWEIEVHRPTTRGECKDSERPCPWVGCRYHLALDVRPNGSITFTHPDLEVWEMAETCALDVADRGGARDLSQLAGLLGLSYDRTFQVVDEAKKRAKEVAGEGAELVFQGNP